MVFAIDSSGSMDAEVGWVQDQLNNFAVGIAGAGIDLNVVVIGNSGLFCVPAPLGSGTCPSDENLPGYRHVVQTVGSTNAFDKILQFHPDWSLSLRAGSRRAIVVVSDDDSATSWTVFNTDLLALDPSLAGYRFHAIVASEDPLNPFSKCLGLAAARGTEYIDLANDTVGIWADLCDQDFGPPFLDMAAAVVADFP